jgi:protocatechuate 3,4-dioxygenase beta subunit
MKKIRRRLLQGLTVASIRSAPGAGAAGLALGLPGSALAATPSCGDTDPTPRQTEGPYFSRNSPLRQSLLETGLPGTRLILDGLVRGVDCAAVAGALLDFWQADPDGEYDNRGYRLRGHQFTDAQGRYRLETVLPGLYPGRTRHLHVKVQAPGGPVLTTQLYFPGEPQNRSDRIFSPALVVSLVETPGGQTAAGQVKQVQAGFDFVIRTV